MLLHTVARPQLLPCYVKRALHNSTHRASRLPGSQRRPCLAAPKERPSFGYRSFEALALHSQSDPTKANFGCAQQDRTAGSAFSRGAAPGNGGGSFAPLGPGATPAPPSCPPAGGAVLRSTARRASSLAALGKNGNRRPRWLPGLSTVGR